MQFGVLQTPCFVAEMCCIFTARDELKFVFHVKNENKGTKSLWTKWVFSSNTFCCLSKAASLLYLYVDLWYGVVILGVASWMSCRTRINRHVRTYFRSAAVLLCAANLELPLGSRRSTFTSYSCVGPVLAQVRVLCSHAHVYCFIADNSFGIAQSLFSW